jgi:hypothetical protein
MPQFAASTWPCNSFIPAFQLPLVYAQQPTIRSNAMSYKETTKTGIH